MRGEARPSLGHPVTGRLREESKHMGRLLPTQRTMSWLREQGYTVGTVERYIHPGSLSVTVIDVTVRVYRFDRDQTGSSTGCSVDGY